MFADLNASRLLLINNNVFLLASKQHGEVGSAAPWACFEGAYVRQAAESISDDHLMQSDAVQQRRLCMQEGI